MKVKVKSPSRLHLGIIDLKGDLGRIYGSIGVTIDKPNVVLTAEKNEQFLIQGADAARTRLFAQRFLKRTKVAEKVNIEVEETIPKHVGLGSGTQLAISIGEALNRIFGLGLSIEEIAMLMGRGRISGVGLYAFKNGGFIVDGGIDLKAKAKGKIPPLIFRGEVPDKWCFLIAVPTLERGLYGNREIKAFKEAKLTVNRWIPGEISRVVLLKMIPSILDRDIESFGWSLSYIERKVGEAFKAVQGGVFRDPVIGEGVRFLIRKGAYAAGQSSWGPAFYGLYGNKSEAEDVKYELKDVLTVKTNVFLASPQNKGAEVKES